MVLTVQNKVLAVLGVFALSYPVVLRMIPCNPHEFEAFPPFILSGRVCQPFTPCNWEDQFELYPPTRYSETIYQQLLEARQRSQC